MLAVSTSPSPGASPAFSSDDERLAAVRRRDPAADEAFVYGVRSTGVYCRPSCAARAARRENMTFHLTCAAAEAAGFRPCRRCRPDEAPRAAQQAALVARACRTIEAAATPPRLAALAAAAGLSPFHFHRLFRSVAGLTPRAYAAAHRAKRVEAGLARAASVTEAMYDAGFNAPSRFYDDASRRLGMTPSAYRGGGAGATIRFAVSACSLGSILVAATERGVCAILLGDDPDALLRDLQDRFPRAALHGSDAAFDGTVALAVGLVEAPGHTLALPLDIGGTAFQQRVWEALRAIPPGRTASYTDIAKAVGRPSAVRAVAQACASNPIAVAIPCHRVVRSDGALSGYRWGIERKRALLDREATGR